DGRIGDDLRQLPARVDARRAEPVRIVAEARCHAARAIAADANALHRADGRVAADAAGQWNLDARHVDRVARAELHFARRPAETHHAGTGTHTLRLLPEQLAQDRCDAGNRHVLTRTVDRDVRRPV